MPIYRGQTKIIGIYKGTTAITGIYKGTDNSYTNDDTRLSIPKNISTDDNTVYFSKVENAQSYSFFLDGQEVGSTAIAGDGYHHYLFNERIPIDDDTNLTFNESFVCNGITYNSLKVYGRDTAPSGTNKYAIYFDSTKVFEERDDSSSLWNEQAYRAVAFISVPGTILSSFLAYAAVKQPEQLSCDLSTLSGWSNFEDGSYVLRIIAEAPSYTSSFPSAGVTFGKNEGFIKGHIYGPFTVTRVVDGDTVVANIKGADMKIRMIGVNTPESVATSGYRTENCQEGIDASNYTKAQLNGQNIYIEFDDDQYDKYNRYLCYIYRDKAGTQMYNNELVAQGYAEAEYYSPNGAHRTFLESTQATARANNVRNWGTGFFPTTLEPPVVSITGSVLSWPFHAYTESYDIKFKKGSSIVYTDNFIQPVGESQNTYDVAAAIAAQGLGTGTFRFNLVAQPTNSTHKTSNNSNTVSYVAS